MKMSVSNLLTIMSMIVVVTTLKSSIRKNNIFALTKSDSKTWISFRFKGSYNSWYPKALGKTSIEKHVFFRALPESNSL